MQLFQASGSLPQLMVILFAHKKASQEARAGALAGSGLGSAPTSVHCQCAVHGPSSYNTSLTKALPIVFSIASTRCPWTTGRTRPRDRGQSSGSNPAHPGIGARASCWLRTFCHSACSVSHEIVLTTLYSFDATRAKFGLWPNHLYNYSITCLWPNSLKLPTRRRR